MQITPIGFIYILLTLFFIFRRKKVFENLFLLCLMTDLFVEAGFVITIGSTIVPYYDYCAYILFFVCLTQYIKSPSALPPILKKLNFCYIFPLFLIVVFPSEAWVADGRTVLWDEVFLEGRRPVHPTVTILVLKTTLKFIFSSFIAFWVYRNYVVSDYKHILIKASRLINVFLCIGLFEYVFKNFLGGNIIWGDFAESVLGTSSSTAFEGRLRGATYELTLFTKEASHYSYALFLCLIIKFGKNILIRKKDGVSFSMLVCVILMSLSTSFSTVLFLFAFVSLFLLHRWGIQRPKKMHLEKLFFVAMLFVGSGGVMAYIANADGAIWGRLSNMFDNWETFVDIENQDAMGDNSTFVRILSVLQTFVAFSTRPLFGLSLNAAVCHGATAMLFSGIGLIGVFCWTKYYYYTTPLYQMVSPSKYLYFVCVIIYLLVNLLNSLDLRPFYDTTLLTIIVSFNFIFSSYTRKSIWLK